MYGFVIVVHILVCILLVAIILMQSGRGGGLTDSFAAAESMFGAKTNVVLVRATTVLSCLFFITCLSLAFLSTKRNQSLIEQSAITHLVSGQEGVSTVEDSAAGIDAAIDAQKEGENANQNEPETSPVAEEPAPVSP